MAKGRRKLKTKQKLLLFIAIVLLFFAVRAIINIPRGTIGGSVVELESPAVRAENDGKVVLVHGTVDIKKEAYDDKEKLSFRSPVVSKTIYYYTRTDKKEKDDDSTEYRWDWEWRDVAVFVGEAVIGEFVIDENLLQRFPSQRESPYTDFTAEEIERFYQEYEDNSLYLSYWDITKIHRSTNVGESLKNVNSTKFTYRYFDASEEVTILAKQSGNQLVPYSEYPYTCLYSGHVTKSDLTRETKGLLIRGAILVLLAVGISGWALKDVLFKKKKRKKR